MSALDGLRVLEGSYGIATAYAGKLLRDQGAEVVKLEPAAGNPLRHWSAASPDTAADGTGALAAFLDVGKASVTVTTHGERDAVLVGTALGRRRDHGAGHPHPATLTRCRPVRSRITRPRR